MRTKFWLALTVTVLLVPMTADAQPYGGRSGGMGRSGGGMRGQPTFMAELYPPEIIMRNQSELGLSDSQKTGIMAATRETRDALDPIQWELQEKQQSLTALVSAPTIDEAALLAQAEEVMGLEMQLKKQHLLLLVRIKNQLTPEQQQKAKSLRGSGRRGSSGGGHGGRPRGGPPGGRP
ncbi:MAG: periplasmic heavy metal sensor [Candidatus Binatia bacterium]|nr:periplasmic heavy metal sensor [Candidatus Binatia bacterium]